MNNKFFLVLVGLLAFSSFISGQENSAESIRQYILDHRKSVFLDDDPLVGFELTDQYFDASSGLIHSYFNQTFQGIPVEFAQIQIHQNEQYQIVHQHSNCVSQFAERVANRSPGKVTGKEAFLMAFPKMTHLRTNQLPITKKNSDLHFWVKDKSLALDGIEMQQLYHLNLDGQYQLTWKLRYTPVEAFKVWEIYIDAHTGQLLSKKDKTVKCHVEVPSQHRHGPAHSPVTGSPARTFISNQQTGNYLVYPFPFESPLESVPEMVQGPLSEQASPFGWHDIDGIEGADYTNTQGNNVHAFIDRDANQEPDASEPDGSDALIFEFPFNLETEPDQYEEAATVQLFYSLNWLHDFAYHYGFDEPVNFQEKNYSGQGSGEDPVIGHVFYGENTGQFNNAFFIPSADGFNGRMRANLWNQSNDLLEINSPASIAGTYQTGEADFGPNFGQFPVEGELAIYTDGTNRPNLGCEEAINAADLEGKIAVIDRGECFFDVKVSNAEKAGAIACIICNFEDEPVGMTSGTDGLPEPGISAISLASSDCARLKAVINEGIKVRIGNQDNEGPALLYSGLDNGVVAHEYAHGISHRLVGGPSSIGCLPNRDYNNDDFDDDGEQMGEGWSDFFTLITTVKSNDEGTKRRTIGNYILRENINGRGVRSFPYSTDINLSPYTYEDVWTAQVPHEVGSVWNAFLWDIFWEMVDLYGFDEDILNGQGGNNKAIRLIMDAMKLTPCNPGFIDGRDAILKADEILNGGANQCLIWEMAAKRGMGYLADQKDPLINADGIASFENLPSCIKSLKVVKSATPMINPGDIIDYTITVANHLDNSAQNIVVNDLLANGLAMVPGTNSLPFIQNGRNIQFNIDQLSSGDTVQITYQAISPANLFSLQRSFDDMESGDAQWDFYNLQGTGIWELNNTFAHSGETAWLVPNLAEENDQVLEWNESIRVEGRFPAIRFYQRLETQYGFDGGIVEISQDGGQSWDPVQNEQLLRNGYNGPLKYDALAIPNIRAFYGKSGEFFPTFIDLRPFQGTTIQFRFRFGSNDFIGDTGWFIDDFEYLDLVQFKTQVCVRADGIEQSCSDVLNEGTFVESDISTPTAEVAETAGLTVYPNPTTHRIFVEWDATVNSFNRLSIYNNLGQQIQQEWLRPNQDQINLNLNTLEDGVYWLTMESDKEVITEKLIKN